VGERWRDRVTEHLRRRVAPQARHNPATWAGQAGQDFERDHAAPGVDFATVHVWPDNWNKCAARPVCISQNHHCWGMARQGCSACSWLRLLHVPCSEITSAHPPCSLTKRVVLRRSSRMLEQSFSISGDALSGRAANTMRLLSGSGGAARCERAARARSASEYHVDWLEAHMAAAEARLGKPLLLEEFGKRLAPGEASAESITRLRDPVYETSFAAVAKSIAMCARAPHIALDRVRAKVGKRPPPSPPAAGLAASGAHPPCRRSVLRATSA